MYSPIDNELMNTKYDASERSLVCRGSFILYFGLGKFCTWLSAWKWNPPVPEADEEGGGKDVAEEREAEIVTEVEEGNWEEEVVVEEENEGAEAA